MVEVVNSPQVSAVLDAAEPSFADLARLEADWDSYGADPVHPEAIEMAKRLVRRVAVAYSWLPTSDLTPFVVPLADGGVQLEWAAAHGRLDVEITGDAEANYLLVRGEGDAATFDEHHAVSLDAVLGAVGRILDAS